MLRRIFLLFGAECFAWGQQFVAIFPDSVFGSAVRRFFYGFVLRKAGHFHALSGLKIFGADRVSIGSGVSMNVGVVIDACDGGEIEIGNDVLIGPYCVIRAADHRFDDGARPIREQGHCGGRIVIEDDCWIGSHVVVTRNLTIGRGSVVGAHSVVTHDIPPYSVAMGVPASTRSRRLMPDSPRGQSSNVKADSAD